MRRLAVMLRNRYVRGLFFIFMLFGFVIVPQVQGGVIFNNENGAAVINNTPPVPTQFSLADVMAITSVRTYHWNRGSGAPGGTISIKNQAGKIVYSAPATIQSRYYWYVEPKLNFPAGMYTIIVSTPQTWSYNVASGNRGFALVNGDPLPQDVKGPVNSYFRPISPSDTDEKGPVSLSAILAKIPLWAVRNTGSVVTQVVFPGGSADLNPGTLFICAKGAPCASASSVSLLNKNRQSGAQCRQGWGAGVNVQIIKCIKVNYGSEDCSPKAGNLQLLNNVSACN